MTLLTLDFMQRALIAALLTGLTAPAVGIYLVQRRLALLGDGIGHVALTGVALGLLTGRSPIITAILAAIIGAVAVELIRANGKANSDVALAMLFYGGIAGGVLLTGLAGSSPGTLTGYLFGSVTTVSKGDLTAIAALAVAVFVLAVGLSRQLFTVSQDEEFAKVSGLPVRFYNLLIAVLAAVTVTVAMRTVGLLLVSALMVVPVATAQQLTRGFRSTFAVSLVLGGAAAVTGVVFSYYVDVAPGASIVVFALAGFAVALLLGVAIRQRRVAREVLPAGAADQVPIPEHDRAESHEHRHGPECGHAGVSHEDHVDYLHDGHLHAPHQGHYDEH